MMRDLKNNIRFQKRRTAVVLAGLILILTVISPVAFWHIHRGQGLSETAYSNLDDPSSAAPADFDCAACIIKKSYTLITVPVLSIRIEQLSEKNYAARFEIPSLRFFSSRLLRAPPVRLV